MKEFEEKRRQGNSVDLCVPNLADDQELRGFVGWLEGLSASPAVAHNLVCMAIDIRQVLPKIGVATLVLDCKGDMFNVEQA